MLPIAPACCRFRASEAHPALPCPAHSALPACLPILGPALPQDLLQRKSDMVGWHERHSQLFHRSNWGVGPRRGLMPLLQSYANGSGGVTAV